MNSAPQVVIAAVDGAAMGGGFGLACVADITIATADASFAMSEVTIGVVAAAISPFVVQRIGLTAARRLAVTGARLTGARPPRWASRILRSPTPPRLKRPCARPATRFSNVRPGAVAATKRLMVRAAGPSSLAELLDDAAERFAAAVRSPEGREGTSAFVEKRKPSWLVQVE